MVNVVSSGSGYAGVSSDWTFKVDAAGLQPGTWYYYDFKALDHYSIRGRTKTAPVGDIDSLRFAVVSCSNYEHGYFTPYKFLTSRNDIDYVLHLGDYIYEYGAGGYSADLSDRINEPANEIITLSDYRIRHSHYKLDENLRWIHQNYPFINVWDDHETANDSYKDGAENHDSGSEGSWVDRLSSAGQAYHEWLPIRSPEEGDIRIYRSFQFGDLVNLPMVDTRIEGRDEQAGAGETNDPSRSLLGTEQYDWLVNNLSSSSAQWNILGNQVMFAPLEVFGLAVNYDQWDGYNYEREQLLNVIQDSSVNNFIVLTGDIHTSWVNDIPLSNYDAGSCTGSAGVEFVVTSVTSTSFPFNVGPSLIQSMNSHMQYINLSEKGYGIMDVSKTKTQFDYYYMDDIEDPNSGQYFAEGYMVMSGETCAQQSNGYSSRVVPNPPLAPMKPIHMSNGIEELIYEEFIIMSAYPNPAQDNITFQIYMNEVKDLTFEVYDMEGRQIYTDVISSGAVGVNYIQVETSTLSQGLYSFVFYNDSNRVTKTIVKSE
jgi:alkaline phosphatase D